ncbi:MAG: insulinase family protein [Clostridium sp.]|nr:insulinase family protein [Clostridium sp.]
MKKAAIWILMFVMCIGQITFAQDFSTFKLDNGQTVIIKEVHDNPIVTIDTWIKTGSINECDENNGVAHFLEHLFFKGTTKHPTGDFDKILESKGAVTNAATSKDFTHYYITIPSSEFQTAMDLHADMLMNPLIPRKELEKERKVVLEEISKTNDEPETKLYENMIKPFYTTHPYKRKVIGRKDVIENITRDEIMNFYNNWYNPSNMITVVVGDINTQTALEAIKQNFNRQETSKCLKPVYKSDKFIDKQIEIVDKGKVKTGYMMIGFRGVREEERADGYALDVLSTILGDGRSSKLYQSVKEQKQLAYSVSAGHASMKDDSIFFIRANFIPENQEKLKKAIFLEIEKLRNGIIDEQEITTAKNIIERDTFYSRESTSNIANELGYTTLVYGDSKYYTDYISNIKKVTKSDLQRVAKKYLNPNRAVISIMLPENIPTENIKKISNIQRKEPVLIKQDKTISQYKLDNNINLIINHNTLNDIFAMQIFSKGGNFIEQKPGTASVTASVMMKGTKKYSALDLSQTMEQNGIKIAPANGADMFTISVKSTNKDLPLTFDLLNEIVNNASLDPQEIQKIKAEKIQAIQKNRDNPTGVVFEEFKNAIWQNSPYGITGITLEKTIPTITQNDVENFYNNVFYPENLVISINGNVNDKEIIEKISNIFCTNKSQDIQKFDYAKYKKAFRPLESTKVIKKAKDTETAWIVIGWLTDGVNAQKDVATLEVINSLLGTGMSSRLFNQLRGEQGLAYQVGSTLLENVNEGIFAIYIGTNPQTALHSKNELLKQVNILKREFVSEQELKEAKDKILGNFILSQETNMEKASTLGWFELSGRGFNYIKEFPKLIESVTPSDIIRVANKYFDAPYVFTIVAPQNCLNKIK